MGAQEKLASVTPKAPVELLTVTHWVPGQVVWFQ